MLSFNADIWASFMVQLSATEQIRKKTIPLNIFAAHTHSATPPKFCTLRAEQAVAVCVRGHGDVLGEVNRGKSLVIMGRMTRGRVTALRGVNAQGKKFS